MDESGENLLVGEKLFFLACFDVWTKGCFPVMRFFYVRLRTCAQYASMNEFTCSEHSVRIRT